MTSEQIRDVRQKKLLVMTDANLCEEMRKHDPTFHKETGFIARTIRERILKIEFPEFALPPSDPTKAGSFSSQ